MLGEKHKKVRIQCKAKGITWTWEWGAYMQENYKKKCYKESVGNYKDPCKDFKIQKGFKKKKRSISARKWKEMLGKVSKLFRI